MGFIIQDAAPFTAIYAVGRFNGEMKTDGPVNNEMERFFEGELDERFAVKFFDTKKNARVVGCIIERKTQNQVFHVLHSIVLLPTVKPFPDMCKDLCEIVFKRFADMDTTTILYSEQQFTYPEAVTDNLAISTCISRDMKILRWIMSRVVSSFDGLPRFKTAERT